MTQAGDSSGRTTSSPSPRSIASASTAPPRVANDSAAASMSTPASRIDAS
jgi:hypothetical protein